MIPLIALCVIVFGILGFRIYRLVQYYKLVRYYDDTNTNSTPKERRVAYINFIIHLLFCLALLYLIGMVVYGMMLMSNGEV
jgi:Na+/proline symporter